MKNGTHKKIKIKTAEILQMDPSEKWLQLTSTGDEDLGFAAGEAVHQRLGPDVGVEERRHAAQFGQTQPEPHKLRLVAQKQRGCVPLFQLGVRRQSPGHFVALPVGPAVRVGALLEDQKSLFWMLLRSIQEAVQQAGKVLLDFAHSHADANCSDRVS